MEKTTFYLHEIYSRESFSFKPTDYSKFKFGSKAISRKFGTDLGEAFCDKYMHEFAGKDIVVLSSPYCHIPTATFAMKDYFLRVLNHRLAEAKVPVAEETKIHRTITYKEDYGELSREERFALIQNDGFHIDTEFIKGKILIFLDDVRITGSHERVIERMMEQHALENDSYFVYFGAVEDPDLDPRVENDINYAFVKDLLDVDKIIKNDEFILNTRVVKYMLNSPSLEFRMFVQYQPIRLLETIYNLAIGNSYHTIDDYIDNLEFLKNYIANAGY